MMNKVMVKKYIIFSFVFSILIISSYSQVVDANQNYHKRSSFIVGDSCFGYVIPLPHFDSINEKPEIQYAVLNLINDLLRSKISVYWTDNTIELIVQEVSSESNIDMLSFEPGTFIVPFTNNNEINNKIIAIMDDYSNLHELHSNMEHVPVFLSYELFTILKAYKLTESKAAYYFGDGVFSSSMNWYVSTLSNAGFLNNEYLEDEEIIERLNHEDYNLFIWPGGDLVNDINSDIPLVIRFLRQNEIKKFVSNGGGYVGSCYGAYAASSGLRVLPFSFLKYYVPNLPSYGYLGLQDSYTALAISCSINVTIDDQPHPVTYGSIKTLSGSELLGGCVFTKLGRNTQSLGTIKEVNATVWTHWFRDLFSSDSILSKLIIDSWVKYTTGKIVWTTSIYGNGKVVAFGDHPEAGNIHHKRIVQNAMLYVTSKEINNLQIDNSILFSDIKERREKCNNLSIPTSNNELFSDVKSNINKTLNDLYNFQNNTFILYNKTWTLLDQEKIDFSLAISMFVSGMWEFTQSIYRSIDFLNESIDSDNTIQFLDKISSIKTLLDSNNISFDNRLNNFKNDLLNKLLTNNESISRIYSNFESLFYELDHYAGSEEQNESIVNICKDQWDLSKQLEKNYPNIYFDSLKMLREMWYYYESNI